MKNMEKVWKAEQQDSREKKKIAELKKEIEMEKDREDIKKYAMEQGVIEKKDDKKLDWMYKGPNQMVDREDYLLGKPIDKSFEQLARVEKDVTAATQNPTSKNHVEHECIPPSLRFFSGNEQVDLARKMQEDPLYAIKKKEMETRSQLLKNPVKLKQLQQLLEQQQEQSKKMKTEKKISKNQTKRKRKDKKMKKRKEDIDSDDEAQLDLLLAAKYKKLKERISDKDLIKSVKRVKKRKQKKKLKKKNDGSSSESQSDERSEEDSSDEETKGYKKRKSKESICQIKKHGKTKKKKHGFPSAEGRAAAVAEEEETAAAGEEEEHQKEERKRKKHGTRSSSSEESNYNRSVVVGKRKSRTHKRNSSSSRSNSSSSNSRDSSSDDRREKDRSSFRSRSRRRRSRNKEREDSRRDINYHIQTTTLNAEDRHRTVSNRESTHKRETVNSGEVTRKKYYNEDRRRRNEDGKRNPAKEQKQALTEEEKERRRQEMIENATWRDKEREQNVKKYREEEKQEMDSGKVYSQDFVRKQLAVAAEVGTVASRIKANINNIQRSGRAMDTNFAKR
ncbi:pre-mRNA-splicing factor CWC25 homolog isoform X2 [Ceratina calcarata]|nr:pre-mRNA-splicing factor CWC25 homolog isoform X2 [Ceratina calcarata]